MTLDLGSLHLVVDRAGAMPAPTSPADPPTVPWPTGPCLVPADGYLPGDLSTDECDATRDRIELAYAPVIDLAHRRAAA